MKYFFRSDKDCADVQFRARLEVHVCPPKNSPTFLTTHTPGIKCLRSWPFIYSIY